ncbi:malonic semialdehyde reductase [Pseudorhodobacter aquimaris]|uniref:malonic semialdehyde reductase n=1 Tax=Pseudorhodobacter aquimaris TaxID=687412 RepID=UPI0009F8D093|nr:malonic semialdehyde reductase [Pseudorhodobacter aquimaris]
MSAPSGQALEAARAKAQQDHRDLRSRISRLSDDAIDLILRDARSHYAWLARPVPDEILQELYGITINGPTSMNTLPARFVFVKSAAGKEKLAKSLKPQNVPKMMGAPVTVIVAYDMDFWKELPFLFPHEDRRHLFDGKPEYCADTAFRNGTLQGAYLMIAARALGLDVGAMSGFSNAIVDEEFFHGSTLKSNFLCNIGYADETALFQKLPRFTFEQACTVV